MPESSGEGGLGAGAGAHTTHHTPHKSSVVIHSPSSNRARAFTATVS